MPAKKIKFFWLLALSLGASVVFPALSAAKAATGEPAKTIPIQHQGRVKSFDSFAHETVELISNKENWDKRPPVDLMLEVLSRPESALELKWIRVNYTELLKQSGSITQTSSMIFVICGVLTLVLFCFDPRSK